MLYDDPKYMASIVIGLIIMVIVFTVIDVPSGSSTKDVCIVRDHDNVLKFETKIQLGDAIILDTYDAIPCDSDTLYYDKDTNTVIVPSGIWSLARINCCYNKYKSNQD